MAMKNIGIHEPCSENWNAMTPTEQGAFCRKCATQVYDFTNKSNAEIKRTLRSLIGQPVCGRITDTQEAALNAEFEAWMFQSKRSYQSTLLFSLIVVFGLTLFSCEHEQDKQNIQAIQASAMQAIRDQTMGMTPVVEPVETIVSVAVPEMLPELPEYVLFEEQAPIELENVLISSESYYGTTGGAMVMTHVYQDYLVSEVVTTPDEELDENGVPYPQAYAATVFPNPVSTQTTFELAVPEKTHFEINLYDMSGQLVQAVYSGRIQRGTFRQQLEMTNLNPGIYLLTVHSKEYSETVRISKI